MGQILHMGFKPRQNPSGLEIVNKFMERMKSAIEEAKSAIYLQGTGRHDTVLQLKEVSGPHVQTRRLGIPRHIRYQNDTSVSKVVTLQTGTLRNRMLSGAVSLLSQVAPQ